MLHKSHGGAGPTVALLLGQLPHTMSEMGLAAGASCSGMICISDVYATQLLPSTCSRESQ